MRLLSLVRKLLVLGLVFLLVAALAIAAGTTAAAGQDLLRDPLATSLSSPQAQAHCAAAGGAGSAQAVHHAGLVIVFSEGRTETLCIEFTEDEISGAELLQRSGRSVVFSSFGGLGAGVCRIDDLGCSDPGDCFCHCRGADCAYWSYFRLEGGEWRFQNVGPSQRRLRDGDADGWVWGSGGQPPGQLGANGPCPAAAASATPTARPTDERPRIATGEKPTPGPVVGGVEPSGVAVRPTPLPQQSGVRTAVASSSTPQSEVRRAAPERRGAQDGAKNSGAEDQGDSASAGLIAFGVVAGILIAGIGGLALRRRFRG